MGGRPARRRYFSPAEPSRNSVVNEGVGPRRARNAESAVTCDVDFRGAAMSLTAKDVAEITRLLEESNFDELYLEVDGLKLSLRRGAGANVAPLSGPGAIGTTGTAAAAASTVGTAVEPATGAPAATAAAAPAAAAPAA